MCIFHLMFTITQLNGIIFIFLIKIKGPKKQVTHQKTKVGFELNSDSKWQNLNHYTIANMHSCLTKT